VIRTSEARRSGSPRSIISKGIFPFEHQGIYPRGPRAEIRIERGCDEAQPCSERDPAWGGRRFAKASILKFHFIGILELLESNTAKNLSF
jgi:hypothetical protein